MNVGRASVCHPRTNPVLFFFLKPSKFPPVLLLGIGLPLLPNRTAYMHHIHLPCDFRADQGTSTGPTSSGVGINIRVCVGVFGLASGRGPAGEKVPPGAEADKPCVSSPAQGVCACVLNRRFPSIYRRKDGEIIYIGVPGAVVSVPGNEDADGVHIL